VEYNEWEAMLRFARVGGREPDEKFSLLTQKSGADDIPSKPAAEAILPICDGMLEGRFQSNLVRKIQGHVAMSIHSLSLPRSAYDFIFKV
jgi:hypothetical protein